MTASPDAGNQRLLQTNIQRNGLDARVDAICCAAGAKSGLSQLHRYKSSNQGRHSLLVEHGHGSTWVPVEPLDNLLERLGLGEAPIAAIKIGVEGYEPWVLDGAPRALWRADALLIELSREMSRAGGLALSGMMDGIAAAGFVPEIWDRDAALPGFEALRDCPPGDGWIPSRRRVGTATPFRRRPHPRGPAQPASPASIDPVGTRAYHLPPRRNSSVGRAAHS
ncbi:MAG: FkbM family methyltransferase [Luteimonas sp.]